MNKKLIIGSIATVGLLLIVYVIYKSKQGSSGQSNINVLDSKNMKVLDSKHAPNPRSKKYVSTGSVNSSGTNSSGVNSTGSVVPSGETIINIIQRKVQQQMEITPNDWAELSNFLHGKSIRILPTNQMYKYDKTKSGAGLQQTANMAQISLPSPLTLYWFGTMRSKYQF